MLQPQTYSAKAISPHDVRLTAPAPELRVSFAAGCDAASAVEQASAILRREGVVVLDDLVDPALLEQCRRELIARYPDYDKPDAEHYLGTYPGRHTAPLVIDQTLAERAVFAPRPIMAIGQHVLGEEKILESLGLLVSLPGAPDQGRHHDGLLYRETQLDRVLPPFAVSIALPLVQLDEVTGTTAFWRRSHRTAAQDGPPDFAPLVPLGSAIVWDFRTHHSGRANRSDSARPVLFSVHSRDWWQEPARAKSFAYRKLQIARSVHEKLSRRMRDFTVRADVID